MAVDLSSENWFQSILAARANGASVNPMVEPIGAYGEMEPEDLFPNSSDFSTYTGQVITYQPESFSESNRVGYDSNVLPSCMDEDSNGSECMINTREPFMQPADNDVVPWLYDSIAFGDWHETQSAPMSAIIPYREQLFLDSSPANQYSNVSLQPSFFDLAMADSEQLSPSFIYIRSKIILGKIDLDDN